MVFSAEATGEVCSMVFSSHEVLLLFEVIPPSNIEIRNKTRVVGNKVRADISSTVNCT